MNVLERIEELHGQLSSENSFWSKIARTVTEETGEEYSRDRVRGLWRRSRPANDSGEQIYTTGDESIKVKVPDTIEMEDDTFIGETLDEFIKRKNIDLNLFSIVEATVNEYGNNEQIKIRLKPKVDEEFNEAEFLAKIDDVVSKYSAGLLLDDGATITFPEEDDECLFIPVIFDAHIDSPHFTANYVSHLAKMVKTGIASGHRPTRIAFIIGNDFGHNDNGQYTTGGTLVGGKHSYIDSIEERCSIILKSCDMLRSYTPKLDIISIPGNHDRFSSIWLSKVVESYYRGDGNVTVMSSGHPRKYYRFNEVLLGLTHGNEEKESSLISLMAVESPFDWAASTHREWFTGHLHKTATTYMMIDEEHGVIKRTFPSLVNSDHWHIYKGFIGNEVAGDLLMYNKNSRIGEFHFPIK